MERTNVFLSAIDRARIEAIKEHYGLASAGAAIRFALRLAMPGDNQRKATPKRRAAGPIAAPEGEVR